MNNANTTWWNVLVCAQQVGRAHEAAGRELVEQLRDAGVHAALDATDRTLPKRLREAQVLSTNFMIVIGDVEVENGTAAVRFRDDASGKAFASALAHLRGEDAEASVGDNNTKAGSVQSVTTQQLFDICAHLKSERL